jgi:hypothetical protein
MRKKVTLMGEVKEVLPAKSDAVNPPSWAEHLPIAKHEKEEAKEFRCVEARPRAVGDQPGI